MPQGQDQVTKSQGEKKTTKTDPCMTWSQQQGL